MIYVYEHQLAIGDASRDYAELPGVVLAIADNDFFDRIRAALIGALEQMPANSRPVLLETHMQTGSNYLLLGGIGTRAELLETFPGIAELAESRIRHTGWLANVLEERYGEQGSERFVEAGWGRRMLALVQDSIGSVAIR
ncbi:MAG: hypothetical protein J0L97_09700 [Alphaproteobacteria bacterium]|nr:hypothetical protein [Alphaproteobacteria bacterium]